MKNRGVIILFLLVTNAFPVHSQIIPDSLRVDWLAAGLTGFYTDSSSMENIVNHGAAANGITDDFPALQSAFNALSGKSGIVYIPSGTYLFQSPVHIPDSVIIRGDGAGQTHILFNLNNQVQHCFNFWATPPQVFDTVIGGFNKGSDSIILSTSNTTYQTGDYVELRQSNGSWDTQPASWAMNSVGQILMVDSVFGNTIKLTSNIHINFDVNLHPIIRKFQPRHHAAIECISFERVDSLAPSINYGIYFYFAANCYVKGVECSKSIGAHVWAEYSTHLEFSGNYFHHAFDYSGSSTKGYGLVLAAHSSDCRIENNIFSHLRHAMMVKQGANGNAILYNYSTDPLRTEFPSDAGADISLHGHYPFANLFEGNIVQNLGIDQSWGPSGPYNTFFRNRIERYGIIMSSGSVQSDRQNIVGNDVPSTILFQGNYILAGSNHFTHGNNIKGTIQPSGTQVLNDSSYVYTSAPSYWNISQSWPNIGTPNTFMNQNNPARERYLQSGAKTICDTVVITSNLPWEPVTGALHNVLNNGSQEVTIQYLIPEDNISAALFDVSGRLIWFEKLNSSTTQTIFKTNSIESGLYMFQLLTKKQKHSTPVLLLD